MSRAQGKPKGLPKSGGRQKGALNTDRQALLDRAQALGLEPWDALVSLAMDQMLESPLRFQAIKEVCSYVYTKTKAVEVSGKDGEPLAPPHPLTLEERIALARAVREAGK